MIERARLRGMAIAAVFTAFASLAAVADEQTLRKRKTEDGGGFLNYHYG